MPVRVLQHGFSPATDNYGMEPGHWTDLDVQAQFLIDLEFLMRYTTLGGTGSCVYSKSPPYLTEIASHFPWLYFYAYDHVEPLSSSSTPDVEYDPDRPDILASLSAPITVQVARDSVGLVHVCLPVKPALGAGSEKISRASSCLPPSKASPCSQVHGNVTTAAYELTKEVARKLGENSRSASRVMICHGADSARQLCLHAFLRPRYSLLDLVGPLPSDYLDGEIMLPMFIPNHKIFACLVAGEEAKCRSYDAALYQSEMGRLTVIVPALLLKN